MVATWFSVNNQVGLIHCIFTIDRLGCPLICGISSNSEPWWDNRLVTYLGWQPQDSPEQFINEPYLQTPADDSSHPVVRYQGGGFAAVGHFEDESCKSGG